MKALLSAFDLLPAWAWALLCSAAIATAAVNAHRLQAEQLAHQTTKAQHATAQAQAEADARRREHEAAQALATAQQKANDEKTDLRRRVAALTDSLRNRPERPADGGAMPEGAAAGVGCTGAGLARPDGEFLAGFAADAARLQIALDQCQAAHNAAVKLTN